MAFDAVPGCLACDLTTGRTELPGGRIHETDHWLVEHCVGPLGPGTLVVKPWRHLTSVAELTEDEASELGPLLRTTSRIVGSLTDADQVYNCLWSHAGGRPAHLHYVVQPVTANLTQRFGIHGPALQAAMFAAGEVVPLGEVEIIATRAQSAFLDGLG